MCDITDLIGTIGHNYFVRQGNTEVITQTCLQTESYNENITNS